MSPFLISSPLFYVFGVTFFILQFTKAYLHYKYLLAKDLKYQQTTRLRKYNVFRDCLSIVKFFSNPNNVPEIRTLNILTVLCYLSVMLMILAGMNKI